MTDELNEVTWPACTASTSTILGWAGPTGWHRTAPYDQECDPVLPLVDELRLPLHTPTVLWRGDYRPCHDALYPRGEEGHEQHTWWKAPENIEHICPGVHVIVADSQLALVFPVYLIPRVRRPYDQARDLDHPGDEQLLPRYPAEVHR